MGPTNYDTLIWLGNISSLSARDQVIEAKQFFGNFNKEHKGFIAWREPFLSESKSEKQAGHRRLMKMCGGSGKQGDEPPYEFVPHSMMDGDKCTKCDKQFDTLIELKTHIKNIHRVEVKTIFSKEALDVVDHEERYNEWLNTSTAITKEDDQSKKLQKLQASNTILA